MSRAFLPSLSVQRLLEELDLSSNFQAYQLVKNYIDNPYIKVRGIYDKAVTERNYTHFFHTANYRSFCPVYPGDTLRTETIVHEMRESRSRPGGGIVVFVHRCFNQRNEEVAVCKRTALMKRKAVQ